MTTKVKTRKRIGRGSLLLIACLLLGSASIRLGVGAGQAFAKEDSLLATETADTASVSEQSAPDSPTKPEQFSTMLKAFQEREARIAEREQQIDMRLKALSVADQQIEKRLAALQQAEEQLRATLALASTAAEDDLARLTAVYETMKPKDAAALFEAMEPTFAAGFLGRMRPDTAAGVMAGLSPQTAYTISVILAGRNADVPKG